MPPLPEGQVVYMPADLRHALAFNRPNLSCLSPPECCVPLANLYRQSLPWSTTGHAFQKTR